MMKLYFNQLVKMQDTMLALQLIQEHPKQQRRGGLIESMIAALLERSSGIKVATSDTNIFKLANNNESSISESSMSNSANNDK